VLHAADTLASDLRIAERELEAGGRNEKLLVAA